MLDLSIIVPVYNAEKYLVRCIDSLIDQKLENYEIILINDGSIDNSGSICESYSDKYDFIKTIHKKNEGQGIARNLGIHLAKGKYISFVDSDDYVNSNCYSVMLAIANKENSDLLIGKMSKCQSNELNKLNCKQLKFEYQKNIESIEALISMLDDTRKNTSIYKITSSSCDKIYLRKNLIENDIRFVSERQYISEDIIFNCQMIQSSNTIICTDLPIYNYVQNEGSFCHTYHEDYVNRMGKMKTYFWENITFEKNINLEQSIYVKLLSYLKSCLIQEIEHKNFKNAISGIKYVMNFDVSLEVIENICLDRLDLNNRILVLLMKMKFYFILYILYSFKLNNK